jgi:hypothetical protein
MGGLVCEHLDHKINVSLSQTNCWEFEKGKSCRLVFNSRCTATLNVQIIVNCSRNNRRTSACARAKTIVA